MIAGDKLQEERKIENAAKEKGGQEAEEIEEAGGRYSH